jgi:SET domain-containing protein
VTDVSPALERRQGLHGDGVFARAAIARGAAVLTLGGPRILPSEAVDELRCVQIGPGEYLGESGGLDDYVNHACDPNLGFVEGTLTLVALRDIAAGDELFWDYSTAMNEPGWGFSCTCGGPSCRGRVTSFCDLDGDAQRRLRPLALSYLR